MKRSVIFIFLLILTHQLGFSQSIKLLFTDTNKKQTFKTQPFTCRDSIAIEKALTYCMLRNYSHGYLTATIDSFQCNSTNIMAYGNMGLKYRWLKFHIDSLSYATLNQIGLSKTNLTGKTLSPKSISRFIKSALTQFENNGYPFAKGFLTNVEIEDNGVNAIINFQKGNLIIIDTIYLKGDAKLNTKKLAAIINIRKGESYSESKIQHIDKRLMQQQHLSIIKPSEVEFLNRKARIYCYLGNRPASKFWGMAGFYKDRLENKVKLNGDINLLLVNALRSGEKLNFSWTAPGQGTQNLNINVDWPYILGWQVGVVSSFSLYKRDSTYITFNPKLALAFFNNNGGRFLVNADYKKTSYNSNNTLTQNQYGNSTAFLYGFGYEFNSYDNALLPIRGMLIKSNLNTGKRQLIQKQGSDANLIEGDLFIENYIPLYESRVILATRLNSKIKTIYGPNKSVSLFENEMYRIGGMSTIRGFNQEMILSQAYSIASLELHLRMSEGSGVFLFTDKAFVKVYELGYRKDTWPLGLGLGINLATKAGIFSLSYALGQGFGQSIGTRDAKVHFGISAVF
ncbi:MAG TPA: hypothetical protein DIW31_09560 [Bacteroidales bacterium]|nr:hypothetical protein [Bacteroidales bacterium]